MSLTNDDLNTLQTMMENTNERRHPVAERGRDRA